MLLYHRSRGRISVNNGDGGGGVAGAGRAASAIQAWYTGKALYQAG